MDAEAVEREDCPWCGKTFQAPAGYDPLKKHMEFCSQRPTLTAEELAEDLETQFHCGALAIAMAAALLTGEEAATIMVGLMADWPDEVDEAAGVIGYRVAMILAETHGITPEELGAVSVRLLNPETEEAGNSE